MTFETASFNPQEFELRNYTDPYVTPEQSTSIALTESRVNGQLDFLAQMLGWNGQNYWTNLPSTPDQKRQLLGGSFGIYNSFFIPRIYEVRNWDNTIVVDRLPFVRPNQQVYVEKILLGDDVYSIQSLTVEGDYYIVGLGTLPQSFYDQLANNVQLKVVIPTLRPAPFYRPEVGVSGDASFNVSFSGTDLLLYPLYDTDKLFQYLSLSLFADAVYYFNQPVYLSYQSPFNPDVTPNYDAELGLWTLHVPKNAVTSSAPITSYLCWDYSDPSSATTVSTPILIQPWVDNSDWSDIATLEYFTGAWGNKGGSLPFNLAFDSLSIHGVSENNALIVPVVERSLTYNSLMEEVYCQLSAYDLTAPGSPDPGDLWWNPYTGALSVWYDPEFTGCGVWVEIDYRQEPVEPIVATLVFPDRASFVAAAPTIAEGVTVFIQDTNGLSYNDGIIGLTGTIASDASLYLYKEIGSTYWTAYRFIFDDVANFETDAAIIPFKTPCVISNASGLSPVGSSYSIPTLGFQVLEPLPAVVTKVYSNNNWVITPDSILRYISQSALFNYENQGEMWWDYANPNYETRAASIYIQSAWVSVNYHPLSGAPTYFFTPEALQFYADGVLLVNGSDYTTGNYVLRYTYNFATESYDFVYTPVTLEGQTLLPTVEVSDSLESTYRFDISNRVFSGMIYKLSPSVADAETPLRIWKNQELYDVGTLNHLVENNYINPLVADQNTGPGLENWERYFIRLPLDYQRNGIEWQRTALICQDFGYWGTSVIPEFMRCPPEDDTPAIYEELFLYNEPVRDYTYIYSEPYLYSNIAYVTSPEVSDYANAGFFPANDLPFDGYDEGYLKTYDPLHNRLADVTSPVGQGYGDWEGIYVNRNPCIGLSGFLFNDLASGAMSDVVAPLWDASIYKAAPTCENDPSSYTVDSNHYKMGYAYFVADASAAEEGFFDPQQQAAWRFPAFTTADEKPQAPGPLNPMPLLSRTLYLTPSSLASASPVVLQGGKLSADILAPIQT